MFKSFYGNLASTNIKKNARIYTPYILMNIFAISMFYIMHSIALDEGLSKMSGGDSMRQILTLGIYVIGIFSAITIFYTNSFIVKQRKKEIGVYHILGLGKAHIAKMMAVETVMLSLGCLSLGLLTGVTFSKLLYMLFLKLLGFPIALTLSVSGISMVKTVILFIAIFTATILLNLTQVHLANPIDLVRGSAVGEKEPKTKWLMTLIGFASLISGYWIALSVKSPLEALTLFFVAVLLVMVGTYSLFTTGSILLLKTLRANKVFYYQPQNFTVISGMLYRMKQNAVGLANITILSTMVIVSLTTTISLYAGLEDMLKNQYPSDAFLMVRAIEASKIPEIETAVKRAVQKSQVVVTDEQTHQFGAFVVVRDGNKLEKMTNDFDYKKSAMVMLYTWEEFLAHKSDMTAETANIESPAAGEAYEINAVEPWNEKTLLLGKEALSIKGALSSAKSEAEQQGSMISEVVLVVKDKAEQKRLYEAIEGKPFDAVSLSILMDMEGTDQQKRAFVQIANQELESIDSSLEFTGRSSSKESFFMIYGGFLFLGLFLGALFMTATVLIMYYKQITEGFDDKMRYETMQKVGMSHKEIKDAIRSQTVMVFFLPLLIAVIHVAFSFNIINRLLAVFNFTNTNLFIGCTAAVVLVFAVFYYGIYRATVGTYFKIIQWKVA